MRTSRHLLLREGEHEIETPSTGEGKRAEAPPQGEFNWIRRDFSAPQ